MTLRSGETKLEGRTRNVSRGGLCVDLAQKLAVGDEAEVDLVLLFEGGTESEPLTLKARIVWCTKLDGDYQIGVVFRPMEPERVEYLTMFLRYLDDPAGKRSRTPLPASIDDRFR